MFAADKCGPVLFNLLLMLACSGPMYSVGLMLPKMMDGALHLILLI
jgi:fructose 1,6-bisphosphatase